MAGGDHCTLSLCVYSAELDTAATGAYCKVYVDSSDRSHGSGGGGGGGGADTNNVASPDPTARSSEGQGARSFHTHVDKSEKKTYLPTWNETFTIDVYDRRNEILTIRLKSKKLLHVSVVGACAIPLHQIPTGRPVDQWFPVQKGGKRRGKLRLQMMITYPQAPLHSVGTPQRSPPPPQQSFGHRRNGSQDLRRSLEQRGSSLHQRPSSISSQHSEHSLGYRQPMPPQAAASPQMTLAHAAVQPHMTLAATGYQPEDEPPKEQSPLKAPTYEIYRPATNPRLDLESDDDDEASFPRVAELHRLESDLIGESSDDEVEDPALLPKSPLYLERLPEDGGDESSPRHDGARASGTHADVEQHLSLDDFKPKERASDSSATRSSVHSESPKPVAAAEAAPAASSDRRTSVEETRSTQVAVPNEDRARMLEASASFESVEESLDMSGIVVSAQEHRSVSSHSSDVVVGEVVSGEVVVAAGVADEVWNRYSSSSSEDLNLPYPSAVSCSSSSSMGVDEGVPVDVYEANPFVEPGSPNHSSEGEREQQFDETVAPRESISSDGGDHQEFFGSERSGSPRSPSAQKVSTSRTSWVGEQAGTPPAAAVINNESSPRNSWVTEGSYGTNAVGSASRHSRTSWVSGESVTPPPVQSGRRDKTWSGTSWIDESGSAAHERSSWVSKHSDLPAAASPRATPRDKSWSGTSWINENENSSFVDASSDRQQSSPRTSWISEKSDVNAVVSSPRRTGRDKTWSGTSWIDENAVEEQSRTSWISEHSEAQGPDASSPRATRRDKSWSGTSWINENSSFVDATAAQQQLSPRSLSTTEKAEYVRRTGRDKSWSGTSWISENENTSFVDATGHRSPRSSWISEGSEHAKDSVSQHSWVSEDVEQSRARRIGRDKSWSGTSWISEHDNTSFVDASAPPEGINSPLEEPQSSPRHSWVSEDGSQIEARRTGREKSWSGTSWISEHDNDGFVDATAQQHALSRTSWVSEAASTPGNREAATSWVSESDTERRYSTSSWISEATHEANIATSSVEDPPRHSWVSEAESVQAAPTTVAVSRTSWVSESGASETAQRPSSPRTSWVSEETNHGVVPSSRTSWVSDGSQSETVGIRSTSRTSWVNEAPNANSFVDASASRHSFVSEGSIEESTEQVTVEAGVAIVAAPIRVSVDPASLARASFLSEISDIIEAQHDPSPRSSISSQPITDPASQPDTILAARISSTSSEASGVVATFQYERHSEEIPMPRSSYGNEETYRGSLLSDVGDHTASNTTPRLSYSSDDQRKHAHFDNVTSQRASVASERLSMEDDASNSPRLSFVSARTTETSVDVQLDVDAHDVTQRFSAESDDLILTEHTHAVAAARESQSSSGRSSGYDADNLETSTGRSSLVSEQTRDRDVDAIRQSTTPRSSQSSHHSADDDDQSLYPESYTDLTRPISLSNASIDNLVDRDDAGRHAAAVAEAARYSSSTDDDFEREDIAAHTHAEADKEALPRRYSSASEGDTVDRSSMAIGYDDYDGVSSRSHSSSVATRDEARFAAWAEESSVNEDFTDEMRRGSQVSSISDMYDASPRASEDMGVIPEGPPRRSLSSNGSYDSPKASGQKSEELLRFVSSVNVFVEPYEDESPRSSISNGFHGVQEEEEEAVEVVEDAQLDALAPSSPEEVRVTVTVEVQEPAAPPPVNPFVEYGSSRGSSSSEEDLSADVEHSDKRIGEPRRSSHSSEGDHEVVVVETMDQLAGPVEADSEPLPSRTSSTSERLTITSQQAELDDLLATREFVAGEVSPHSSLSSVSPRDHAYDTIVAAADLLQRATEEVETDAASHERSSSQHDVKTSTPETTTTTAPFSYPKAEPVSSRVAVAIPMTEPVVLEAPPAEPEALAHSPPPPAPAVAYPPAPTETVTSSSSAGDATRANLRGDHVLLASASTLTREQLSLVALDHLPSSDSESESDGYGSDDDLNFDSD